MGQDKKLARLKRVWELEPTGGNAEAYLNLARRLKVEVPKAALRQSVRWKPMVDFIHTWFDEDVSDWSGNDYNEIRLVEKDMGFAFPEALREWFLIVGKTLCMVQDFPVLLESHGKGTSRDFIRIYREAQDCCHWYIKDHDVQDPPVYLDDGGVKYNHQEVQQRESLSKFVYLKLLVETMDGIIFDRSGQPENSISLFGYFSEEARGGEAHGKELLTAIRREYNLYYSGVWWPGECEIYVDKHTLIISTEPDSIRAATASELAWNKLDELVNSSGHWYDD